MNDGGNAFPVSVCAAPSGDVYHSHQVVQGGGGMSLRDYFAAHVIQGMVSSEQFRIVFNPERPDWIKSMAQLAYMTADAMLEARTTKTNT